MYLHLYAHSFDHHHQHQHNSYYNNTYQCNYLINHQSFENKENEFQNSRVGGVGVGQQGQPGGVRNQQSCLQLIAK